MNNKPLKLEQTVLIKAVDSDKEGVLVIKGIASMYRTPEGFLQVDRDNELVNLDFMDLDSYRKNPILCFQHDWSVGVGKVVELEHRDGALHFTAEVHRLTGLEHIYEGVQKGIIKSVSISAVPHEFIYRETHDGDILEIASSTLVEISLTTVQSNQEALFDVIAQKSPTISKKMLARQNGMTCDELDGSCAFKSELQEKGINIMSKEVKEEPKVEPKVEPKEEPKVEPKVEPKEEPKVEPKEEPKAEPKVEAAPVFDEAALVAAIEAADIKKQDLITQKAEEAKQKEEEDAANAAAAKVARADDAKAYIKERIESFTSLDNADVDTEAVEDLYEFLTENAEAIEKKIVEVIQEQAAPAA